MVRHVSTVLLSAFIGSLVGALLLVVWSGGTGSTNPARVFAAVVAATMVFTIPGAVLLMAMTFVLADRRISLGYAAVLLVLGGTLAGAAMLSLLSMDSVVWGAVFGCVTAATFVGILSAFRGYPQARGQNL